MVCVVEKMVLLLSRDIEVKQSPLGGLGVFALVPLRKGCIISPRYCPNDNAVPASELPVQRFYRFGVSVHERKMVIIPNEDDLHWTARLNHSSSLDRGKNVELLDSGRMQCLRDVDVGEELLFDYGDDYWAAALKMSMVEARAMMSKPGSLWSPEQHKRMKEHDEREKRLSKRLKRPLRAPAYSWAMRTSKSGQAQRLTTSGWVAISPGLPIRIREGLEVAHLLRQMGWGTAADLIPTTATLKQLPALVRSRIHCLKHPRWPCMQSPGAHLQKAFDPAAFLSSLLPEHRYIIRTSVGLVAIKDRLFKTCDSEWAPITPDSLVKPVCGFLLHSLPCDCHK
jgi:hypothetical protein